jgi:hypothetical protein
LSRFAGDWDTCYIGSSPRSLLRRSLSRTGVNSATGRPAYHPGKDNGEAFRRVCLEFVVLCRRLELFSEASVAIDGSKFKAVNTRDRNFT